MAARFAVVLDLPVPPRNEWTLMTVATVPSYGCVAWWGGVRENARARGVRSVTSSGSGMLGGGHHPRKRRTVEVSAATPGRIVARDVPRRAASLFPDRRHLRLHGVSRRRRARSRAGHPRGPRRRGRLGAPTELPARQARRRRRLHLHVDGRDRRLDAARHDRALLLRIPEAAARRPPSDVVRLQRL